MFNLDCYVGVIASIEQYTYLSKNRKYNWILVYIIRESL